MVVKLTTVGPEIRALREKHRIPIETLALRAGVNLRVLYAYESMKRITTDDLCRLPSEAELQRIAKILRTTVSALMRRAHKRLPRARVLTSGGVMTIEEYITAHPTPA